jgi:hypothetical protein
MYSQSKVLMNLTQTHLHLHMLEEENEDNYRNVHSEQPSPGSKLLTTELTSRN